MTKAENFRVAAAHLEEVDDGPDRAACCDVARWLRKTADRMEREASIRTVAREKGLPVRAIRTAARAKGLI